MGDAVKIIDLAENVIRINGFVPYVDIDIEITGRPGENCMKSFYLMKKGLKILHTVIFVAQPVNPSPALMEILSKGDNHLRCY